jgi:superfamily I DNA and RNA helicase
VELLPTIEWNDRPTSLEYATMAKLSTNAKTIERQDGSTEDLTLALDKKRRIDTASTRPSPGLRSSRSCSTPFSFDPIGRVSMLDEFQSAFCNETARNIRLLAPAGSGKTHSLLYRCAEVHRVQKGSARFLLLTFTRAARD